MKCSMSLIKVNFLPIHGTEVMVMQPVRNTVFVEHMFAFLDPHDVTFFLPIFLFSILVDSLLRVFCSELT